MHQALSKHFTYIDSLNLHDNHMISYCYLYIKNEEINTQKLSKLPMSPNH